MRFHLYSIWSSLAIAPNLLKTALKLALSLSPSLLILFICPFYFLSFLSLSLFSLLYHVTFCSVFACSANIYSFFWHIQVFAFLSWIAVCGGVCGYFCAIFHSWKKNVTDELTDSELVACYVFFIHKRRGRRKSNRHTEKKLLAWMKLCLVVAGVACVHVCVHMCVFVWVY